LNFFESRFHSGECKGGGGGGGGGEGTSITQRGDDKISEQMTMKIKRKLQVKTQKSKHEVLHKAFEQLRGGKFSSFDTVNHFIRNPQLPSSTRTSMTSHCSPRYTRIKNMLLNAAAGSAASALKELSFETALAAKHLKVTAATAVPVVFCVKLNRVLCRGALLNAGGSSWS
jgi:hypothetical protein